MKLTAWYFSGFRRIAAFEFWLPQLRRAHFCLSVRMSGIRVGARAPGDSVESKSQFSAIATSQT